MSVKTENSIAIALLIAALVVCVTLVGFSQTSQSLEGTWINEQGTRKAELYKQESKYTGKMVWVAENEDKLKLGDIIFKELTGDGKRFRGLAVTPKQGDVPCTILFEGEDKIKITVSKGRMSRSVYWTRVK